MLFQESKMSFEHFQAEHPYSNRVQASTENANYLVCWDHLSSTARVYPTCYKGYEEIGNRQFFTIWGKKGLEFQMEEVQGSHSFKETHITLKFGWKYFFH